MITLIATGFKEGNSKRKEDTQEKIMVSLESHTPVKPAVSEKEVIDFEDMISDNVIDFDTDDVRKTIDMLGVKRDDPSSGDRSKLSEEMRKKREADAARREFLRKNNSKPLDNPKIISDIENVPAYARRNVVLDDTSIAKGATHSNYTVNMDEDNNIIINNNSYLYNNVD